MEDKWYREMKKEYEEVPAWNEMFPDVQDFIFFQYETLYVNSPRRRDGKGRLRKRGGLGGLIDHAMECKKRLCMCLRRYVEITGSRVVDMKEYREILRDIEGQFWLYMMALEDIERLYMLRSCREIELIEETSRLLEERRQWTGRERMERLLERYFRENHGLQG